MVKVSVIIPVYNTEKFLDECIHSVLAQSLDSFELVLVDDGSSDSSPSILDNYAATDPRVKVIHQLNQGQSAARNAGTDIATGEYLYFVDSDDKLATDHALEELYDTCKQNDLDMCFFNSEMHFENVEIEKKYAHARMRYVKDGYHGVKRGEELFIEFMKRQQFTVAAWLYMVRRELLVQHQIRFLEGVCFEDNLFTFTCLIHANKTMHVARSYYCNLSRENSTIVSSGSIKKLMSMNAVAGGIAAVIQKANLSPEGYAAATAFWAFRLQDMLEMYVKLLKEHVSIPQFLNSAAKLCATRFISKTSRAFSNHFKTK